MLERGVTLLELMAVVVIIGIFVALASPAMSGVLADRHAMRASDDIVGMVRLARSRASATGSSHMLRVLASGTSMSFELRAAMANTGGPISSCVTPAWTNADSAQIAFVDFGALSGSYAGRNVIVKGTAQDFCFTPGGVPWWRVGGNWKRPAGSERVQFQVARFAADGVTVLGINRVVRVSSSGLPVVQAD